MDADKKEMDLLRQLWARPAYHRTAARSAGIFLLSGAGFLTLFSVTIDGFTGSKPWLMTIIVSVLVALGVRALLLPDTVRPIELVLKAPVVSVTIALQNYLTNDASAGAQMFLLWPVLYAALFLNLPQTILTVATAVTANTIVLAELRPGTPGFVDAASMTTAFSLAVVVVQALRRKHASLMAAAERLALQDELTGLGNRRRLQQALEAAVARRERDGTPVSLITIDVDLFKSINDTYGHEGGDRVLQRVADVLREAVRADDVTVRLGGDEFVVVMAGCTPDDAHGVAESVRRLVCRRIDGVTVSVGVATVTTPHGGIDAILRASDAALYRAKTAGRDRVVAAVA